MTLSDDNIIKKIKEQRNFEPTIYDYGRGSVRLCERCGLDNVHTQISVYDINDGEVSQMEPVQPWCHNCVRSTAKPVRNTEKPVRRLCRYCGHKRKLIGVWCAKCRDLSHRIEIKTILSKNRRTQDDNERLRFYSKFPIWKKEFGDVEIG